MNKIKNISFLLLLAASLSLQALSLPESFTPEDDMTSFDDLAAAGHHLRGQIKKDGERYHEAQVARLVNTYKNCRNAYASSSYHYNLARHIKEEKEAALQRASYTLRSSWQWPDYVIGAAVIRTFAGAGATVYELAQQQYGLALGYAAVTTAAFFTWGCGADWADDGRFAAADNLKKEYEAKEQDAVNEFQELTEKKEADATDLKRAYAALLAANPRTVKAQAWMNTVEFPKELRS